MLRTGNATLDNILTVILSSSMFLAMTLGFVLDNTIPGTDEERGVVAQIIITLKSDGKWTSFSLQDS